MGGPGWFLARLQTAGRRHRGCGARRRIAVVLRRGRGEPAARRARPRGHRRVDPRPARAGEGHRGPARRPGGAPPHPADPDRAQYGGAYFAVALVAQLARLVAAARLVVGRVERGSAPPKGALVGGLIAPLAG